MYDKNSFPIIGCVDVGDLNNHLLEQERSERVASNILMLMVRGLFPGLELPYAQFPCTSLSADIVFPLVWASTKRLETCGFKVLACIADGALCNQSSYIKNKTDTLLEFRNCVELGSFN